MYIRQTDLFWGLNQNVVSRVMGIAQHEAFDPGEVLFRPDDAARHLFILAQGEVRIAMDETGGKVYTGNRVGEAFGWGSLIDCETYGCSAICTTPVVLLKMDRDRLLKLLDNDMESGYLFFKHLSRALGGRLFQAYHRLTENDLGGHHGKT